MTPMVLDMTVASFHLSQNGLRPVGTPTFVQWLECGQFIRNTEQSVQFWIGDWLVYGEQAYGKTDYEQALQETGLSYQTLRIYKHVATALPLSLRRNKLSFHHHKEVASLSPETQAHLLQQAVDGTWPLFKLKQEKYRLRLEAARPPASPAETSGLLLGEAAQLLEHVPDASVDMVLTAPSLNTADLTPIETTLPLILKKLKENSHVYIFTDWRTYPGLFPLMQQYFTVKNLLVWDTKRPAAGENTRYREGYECVLFGQKGRRHLSGRRDASILEFPAEDVTALAYPMEKPLPLLSYLIEKSTHPGEVVCDPFMGTGAVCLAAKQTGRRYLGMERDKTLFDIARSRLA